MRLIFWKHGGGLTILIVSPSILSWSFFPAAHPYTFGPRTFRIFLGSCACCNMVTITAQRFPGQEPLHTRATPTGRPGHSPLLQEKVHDANRCMDIALWFAEQTLACATRTVALLFISPEDFGGHQRKGPASPSAIHELQQLQGVSDARKGAAFLCRLSESEFRCPLVFLSNMDTFCKRLHDGWPCLSSSGDQLDGPLPKTCPCTVIHKKFKGLTNDKEFVSSFASFGKHFWNLVLTSFSNFIGHTSYRAGGSSPGVTPNVEALDTFSLSTSSSSWRSFYSSRACSFWITARRSKYLRVVCARPLSSWVPSSFPPTAAASHCVSPPPSIRLRHVRSRSPRRTKSPLIHNESTNGKLWRAGQSWEKRWNLLRFYCRYEDIWRTSRQ